MRGEEHVVVLGIDPGVGRTGYGLVQQDANGDIQPVGYGVIETTIGAPLPARLRSLYEQLQQLYAQYQPDEIAVEELFFSRNVTTAIAVGEARGVILLFAALADLPLYHYKPAEVKQAVVGVGNASKRQVQEMVRMLLHLEELPRPDDAADALAVAICHMNWAAFRSQMRNSGQD